MEKLTVKKSKYNSKSAWFLFNVLRIIPCIIFGIPAFIFYFFKYIFNIKKYSKNKQIWDKAKTSFVSLIIFFNRSYKYKFDFLRGFCDHDSSIFEWYCGLGDCDDVARYARNALKKIGYHGVQRIGLIGKHNNHLVLHFDCMWCRYGVEGSIEKVFLLNYGDVISGNTIDEVIDRLSYRDSYFPKGETKICKSW